MTTAGARDAVAALDLAGLVRFADLALDALGAAREQIDALNVYPVPDGDTGTNMYLTVESARTAMLDALQDAPDDPRGALAAFARGALLGARGSSGVILSQLVGALCQRLAGAGPDERAPEVLAEGLAAATQASYAAVGQPVEGTMLSVARAASEAAAEVLVRADAVAGAGGDEPHRLAQVVSASARAARAALARTPEQLTTLREAGVVDAGGRGLCVLLDAAETALTGRRAVSAPPPFGVHAIPVPVPSGDLSPDGPAYEVMFLLEADDAAVPAMRATLAPLGDSLVVVGGDGLWNVHVHVDDVGAAVEAGIVAGRPYRVRVTHFAEQVSRAGRSVVRQGRSVVAVAAGVGLAELFVQAGAVVVPGGPGRRPTTVQIVEAVRSAGAAEVIVLPNDRESVAVAEAAARSARESGEVRVAVIPTDAQVQGLAALAVHEPGRSFEQDIVEMSSAARHARSGAVSVARSQAMTTAGPCEPGDALGMIEGDYVLVGDDLFTVAAQVLERLLGGGGELVTLVSGGGSGGGSGGEPEEGDVDLAERCASYLQERHPTVDVVVYDGGQADFPLLVGVE